MTARYPMDLARVDELLGLLSGAPLVDRPALASQLGAEVPGLVAEVFALRASLAIAESEVERLHALRDAAWEWRQMRADGAAVKPKPEAAALIAAVDALMRDGLGAQS